jgi:membrane dipeptidase
MTGLDRRQLLGGAGAGVAAFLTGGPPALAASSGFAEADYRRAVVIDAMGGIYDPVDGPFEAEPSPRLLSDLRASGVTAVSMTLSVGTGGDRLAKAIRKIAALDEKCAAAPDVLMRVRSGADLKVAKATGRVGLIYNVQDTSLLENDLERVATLRLFGLRQMQLTYNIRNPVGDGSIEPANSGLSLFGRQLVDELARQHIVMDLSHSGQRTIAEAIERAKAPPVISHTGCRALADLPRNVYDAELKALADKGGVVGIYFMPFLTLTGQATRDDLITHLEHAVKVCGEDHVGMGTDGGVSGVVVDEAYRAGQRREFEERSKIGIAAPGERPDWVQVIEGYNDPRRFLHLAQDLSRRGWPSSRIEKVLGANFARVFAEVWG